MQTYDSDIILNNERIIKLSKALRLSTLPMFKMLPVVQLLQCSRPQLKKVLEILLVH